MEAEHLEAALRDSPVAYSYYDASDRLLFWNDAYTNLNFRIKAQIRRGAFFPDLLAELVVRDQIDLYGVDFETWVAERLHARRLGYTAFRMLTDGRVYLVQERRDDVGGTLGFWLNVTDLFEAGALKARNSDMKGAERTLADQGTQEFLRNKMQTITGNLELLQACELGPVADPSIEDAITAANSVNALLDQERSANR
jgi:PAS domain-containing protein